MIFYAPHDVAFKLFGINIYWYGIIMAVAIFISVICANNLFNENNDKKNIIIDSATLIIIIGLLCARIYFCTLNPAYYFSHPSEILNIREGGLSIHGAIIGGLISLFIIAKKNKISFLKIADPCACATLLGQAIGRWGNFFNSEAYGIPIKNQNWGLYIPFQNRISGYENFELFHPTFLYECISDLIAFVLLTIIYKHYKKTGFTFFTYLIIYALIRYFIEQLRIDSALNIGNIPIAVIISIILFICGLSGLIYTNFKKY